MRFTARVARWGDSLAIELPAAVVSALDLKLGDDLDVQVVRSTATEVGRQADLDEALQRLRKLRGRMPADFKFDRLEANDRQDD